MGDFFRHLAHRITLVVGSWQVFLLALFLIAGWAASGPFFGFSDTWQLVINTSTTIVTFLLGILILLEANRQAKESKVVHDELIRAVRGARNELINVDEMSEAEVDRLEADLERRAARVERRRTNPGRPASQRTRLVLGRVVGGSGRTFRRILVQTDGQPLDVAHGTRHDVQAPNPPPRRVAGEQERGALWPPRLIAIGAVIVLTLGHCDPSRRP